jgi:hypothetical protein
VPRAEPRITLANNVAWPIPFFNYVGFIRVSEPTNSNPSRREYLGHQNPVVTKSSLDQTNKLISTLLLSRHQPHEAAPTKTSKQHTYQTRLTKGITQRPVCPHPHPRPVTKQAPLQFVSLTTRKNLEGRNKNGRPCHPPGRHLTPSVTRCQSQSLPGQDDIPTSPSQDGARRTPSHAPA